MIKLMDCTLRDGANIAGKGFDANALAAYQNGAQILDCGLMGMARSAGNLATEICVALMQGYGEYPYIDLYGMLDGIEKRLMPVMEPFGFHNPISPFDLILGVSGAHSSFGESFKKVAAEYGISVYRLIAEVSRLDRHGLSDWRYDECGSGAGQYRRCGLDWRRCFKDAGRQYQYLCSDRGSLYCPGHLYPVYE